MDAAWVYHFAMRKYESKPSHNSNLSRPIGNIASATNKQVEIYLPIVLEFCLIPLQMRETCR